MKKKLTVSSSYNIQIITVESYLNINKVVKNQPTKNRKLTIHHYFC